MFIPPKSMAPALFILLFSSVIFTAENGYDLRRQQMVETDLRESGLKDHVALVMMRKVPRHLLIDESLRSQAYGDHPLPIGEGQTVSQQYVVALMTESLRLKPGDRVLEIGTGSGYQAAVLAEIVKAVYTIEIQKALADGGAERLASLGYRNVKVKYVDGYFGWDSHPRDEEKRRTGC
jgi:protein-L-isoaspartate(D-aspartate) O-methyltransferase